MHYGKLILGCFISYLMISCFGLALIFIAQTVSSDCSNFFMYEIVDIIYYIFYIFVIELLIVAEQKKMTRRFTIYENKDVLEVFAYLLFSYMLWKIITPSMIIFMGKIFETKCGSNTIYIYRLVFDAIIIIYSIFVAVACYLLLNKIGKGPNGISLSRIE